MNNQIQYYPYEGGIIEQEISSEGTYEIPPPTETQKQDSGLVTKVSATKIE